MPYAQIIFRVKQSLHLLINQLDQSIIHLVKTHPNQLINPNSEHILIVFNLKWENELPSFCYVSWVNYFFHVN